MRKRLTTFVSMILLPVMVIISLQSAFSSMSMASSHNMDQMQQDVMQMNMSMSTDTGDHECDHCDKHKFCENGCVNCQCYATPVVMLSSNDHNIDHLIQTEFLHYPPSVIASPTSSLFRPPRV